MAMFDLNEIKSQAKGNFTEAWISTAKLIPSNTEISLDRKGKPCIRFDSKDIIKWADYSCDCGRTFRIIDGGVIGRADDITKVKGVLLAPTAIEEVVRSIPECANDYQVTVSKKGETDDIMLEVELAAGCEEKKESVLGRLKDQLRVRLNLGFKIEVRPCGSLPRFEVKAKRFRDLRKEKKLQ